MAGVRKQVDESEFRAPKEPAPRLRKSRIQAILAGQQAVNAGQRMPMAVHG